MIISITGMPLSGKTTLINEIKKEIDIPVLSTGDLARELGMRYEESIKSYDMSMDLNEAIIDHVLTFINEHKHCILDGFPRSEEQIKLLMSYNLSVIFVQANPLEIYERAVNRNRDKNDKYEVVVGRCEASIKLKQKLYEHLDNFIIFTSDDRFDEYKGDIIKYIKGRIK